MSQTEKTEIKIAINWKTVKIVTVCIVTPMLLLFILQHSSRHWYEVYTEYPWHDARHNKNQCAVSSINVQSFITNEFLDYEVDIDMNCSQFVVERHISYYHHIPVYLGLVWLQIHYCLLASALLFLLWMLRRRYKFRIVSSK